MFLIGADELADLPGWKRPERVLELVRIGVAMRPGVPEDRLRDARARLPAPGRIEYFEMRAGCGFVDGDPRPGRARRGDRRPRAAARCRRHRAPRTLRRRRVHCGGGRKDADRLTPLEQARRTAALCQEKLATDVTILDMRGVCDFTDFFVIATGRNARQTKAIYDEVAGTLKKEQKLLPRSTAGVRESDWIVADYLDVVLHLFTPETRGFYRLEDLWSDVPSVELAASAI